MRFDSTNARFKLLFAALLLALFAIPFASHWQTVTAFNGQAVLAGGAVVANGASQASSTPPVPATNHVGQSAKTSGNSFLGASAR